MQNDIFARVPLTKNLEREKQDGTADRTIQKEIE